jgi:hypothetical protein
MCHPASMYVDVYKNYTRGVQHFNQHEIVLYHVVFIISITTLL